MRKRIVIDTSTGGLDYYPFEHGIEILRIKINIKGQEYEDGLTLKADQFYDMLKNDKELLPKTSQPSVGDVMNIFQKFLDEGVEEIFVVTISAKMSGTYNSCIMAAKEFEGKIKIKVFDTKTVLYITIPYLITELKESMSKNRLTTFRKQLMSYDLIIADELGYCSFDKEGSELLFNFFSMRNEFKSTIITTNLTFKDWPSVFGDNTLSAALIDRLTHRAIILNMSGESHRHKEALQNMKVAQN